MSLISENLAPISASMAAMPVIDEALLNGEIDPLQGAKADALITLQSHQHDWNYTVPSFFVLTINECLALLGKDLSNAALKLAEKALDAHSPHSFSAIEQEITALLLGHIFEYEENLQERIQLAFGPNWNHELFAIRASCVHEGRHHSFAGIYHTALYITGWKAIKEAILQVLASNFSAQALSYLAHHKLTPQWSLAIILQKMAPAEISGILSTGNIHPHDPEEMVLISSYGVGHGITSGALPADRWHLTRNGSILQSFIHPKDYYATFDSEQGSGLRLQQVPSKKQKCPAIPTPLIEELTKLAPKIESLFENRPQDIEWCWSPQAGLSLLQARTITHLRHIDRRFDREYFSQTAIPENANAPLPPLMLSVAESRYRHAYQALIQQLRPGPLPSRQLLAIYKGRLLLNSSTLERALGTPLFRLLFPQEISLQHPACKLPTVRSPRHWPSLWRLGRMLMTTLFRASYQPQQDELAAITSENAFVWLQKFTEQQYRQRNLWTQALSNETVAALALQLILKLLRHDPLARLKIFDLMTAINDESHDGHKQALLELGRIIETIGHNPALRQAVTQTPVATLVHELLHAPDHSPLMSVREPLFNFINRWGEMTACPLHLQKELLQAKSEPILQIVQHFLAHQLGPIQPQHFIKVNQSILLANIEQQLAGIQIGGLISATSVFKLLWRLLQITLKRKQKMAHLKMGLNHQLQTQLREVGATLVQKELLSNPDDLLYLQLNELRDLLAHRDYNGDWGPLIAQRRAQHQQQQSEALPATFFSYGPLWDKKSQIFESSRLVQGILQLPPAHWIASPGQVEGVVLNARDLKDHPLGWPAPGTLGAPEIILILPYAESRWILYLPFCKGLIIEQGHPLAHLLVVARELGLPALLGLSGISEHLKSGDPIYLDAVKGEIRKKNGPSSEF